MLRQEGIPKNSTLVEYEEKLLEGVRSGGGVNMSRSYSFRRGVSGLVRKVSQRVVNNNKGIK